MPSPNVITSTLAILNQITTELIALTSGNASNVFIAAHEVWLETPPGDFYIQIILGAGIDKWANQEQGWILDNITVCTFKKVLFDEEPQDSQRIANASVGLLNLVAIVEGLSNSQLAGLALVPVKPTRREDSRRNPQDPYDGWAMIPRQFTVEYRYPYPSRHSTS